MSRKPYKQTTFDPGANLFAIGINDAGEQCAIARCDTAQQVRDRVRENFRDGRRTEVAVLNLSQLDCVMKRILKE